MILVTGAGAGIGKTIAETFAGEGAKIVVNDINVNTAREVAESIQSNGGTAAFVQGDTTKEADAENMVGFSVDTYGSLDVVVNNAGIEIIRPIHEMTEEEWDSVANVNMKGYFFVSKHAVRRMLPQGKGNILNVASLASLIGFPLLGVYCATKHAVLCLTRSMALELRGYGIRINALCPAVIKTDLGDRFMEAYKAYGVPIEDAINSLQHRLGNVDEVAAAALFLASDESPFVTGVALPVDGGGSAA